MIKNSHIIYPNSKPPSPPLLFPCFPCFPSHNIPIKQNMSTTSTVVYQGLQSCLEPILLEPRVLMHQLVPSKQTLSFPYPKKQPENSKNANKKSEESPNCWNFMKTATNPSYNSRKSTDESEKVYVHPLSKLSASSLSTKSLEMCTESLGSETGSLVDSNIEEYSEKQRPHMIKEEKTRESMKKVRHGGSFPPPLTSISGREGVQVQTHREGGRLVIKAFSYSCCGSYFQVERESGRLRLSLLKDGKENETDIELDRENVDGGEEEEGELRGGFWGENMKDDGGKVWASSRCNDDKSKRISSLPFWVAIS